MSIVCIGFGRTAHHVSRLHGHSLCDSCYLKQYRAEHATDIIKYQKEYQKEYRADSGYREQARIYMQVYRNRQS